MRANGYGADIELTDDAVVIHSGKAAARLQKTATVTVPLGDIQSVQYRPANAFVNGSLKLRASRDGDDLQSYGADPGNRVNTESLVVHWRRKDEAAFAEMRDAINARVIR